MSAAALVLVLGAWLGTAQGPAGREERLEVTVPRMENAEAQLAYARRLKGQMHARPDKDRGFWRKLAVEAYRAVVEFHPAASSAHAEASFRAGELLRAGGDAQGARAQFVDLRKRGSRTAFHARAGLELGHLARRRGDQGGALDAYLSVASDPRAAASHRDDAWLWAGRMWEAEGHPDDARRAWQRVADDGEDALDRIHAFNLMGLSWITQGDLEAAAGVLDACLTQLSETALEETRRGERVRNSLLRMRLATTLQQEIAKRVRDQETAVSGSW